MVQRMILRKKEEEGLGDWKNGDKKSIRGKAKEWKSVPRSNHQPWLRTKMNGQLLQFYMMPLQWAIPFLPLLFYLLEETIIINPNALICSLWLLACALGPFAY
uniref:Uncharacterized protein n=1 Tax=Gossypium raimondii TaxID=29730 RepID=A0A0D2RP16_GOSRA|nr:hypothetical protein B456_006G016200 [Gossypium raimondii]